MMIYFVSLALFVSVRRTGLVGVKLKPAPSGPILVHNSRLILIHCDVVCTLVCARLRNKNNTGFDLRHIRAVQQQSCLNKNQLLGTTAVRTTTVKRHRLLVVTTITMVQHGRSQGVWAERKMSARRKCNNHWRSQERVDLKSPIETQNWYVDSPRSV